MVDLRIHISDSTLRQLEAIANEEAATIEEVASRWIEERAQSKTQRGTLAALAESALEADLASDENVNSAQQADQI
ncbi:MAG: hypothetical protein HXY40_07540 [Chloroflexi bacterium]|nr:hypothetical protein [Chloroflexota bacterium]